MTSLTASDKPYDTAIIGAGIMGLWAARHAIKRGERVIILEKRNVGAGASGGLLGALMPHMPDSWNAKKQYQYDGLTSIETAVRELEEDTGIDCGYRRCGRVIPLRHEKMLGHMQRRMEGAAQFWGDDYTLQWIASENLQSWMDENGFSNSRLNADLAPFGIHHDTLAARIAPRACLSALEAYACAHATLQTDVEVTEIIPGTSLGNARLKLLDGTVISAGKVMVSAGWEAYPLVQPFMAGLNDGKAIGRGVKGQAVLLDHAHDDTGPIVYDDGVYVVPQQGNRVAIGSTSVNDWQTSGDGKPGSFDENALGFLEQARALSPELKHAPIAERWAGVRPRNTLDGRGTAPYFSPVPGYPNLYALLGGFKITLALAHLPFSQYAANDGFFPVECDAESGL